MSAITVSVEHVISALTAGGSSVLVQGRVFQGIAPVKAKTPMILVQSYGDSFDLLGLGRPIAGSTIELLVKVLGTTDSLASLEPIHNSVFSSLHGTSGVNSRGSVSSCVRVSESEFSEVTDSGTVRQMIGRYRIVCSEISN